MKIQKTDWGHIRWDVTTDENLHSNMHVGKVFIEPYQDMVPHIHYEEQIIYVLEGEGVGYVNGVRQEYRPGAIYQMEPGCTHAMTNTGETRLIHLLITNPIEFQLEDLIKQEDIRSEISMNELIVAIEAVRTQFLANLQTPYSIYDRTGILLTQGEYIPPHCRKNCGAGYLEGNCACMEKAPMGEECKEYTLECPYGLQVYWIPVAFNEKIIGRILGGHIRVSSTREVRLEGVYDTPQSTASDVILLLRKVAKAIRNFCEFNQFREEFFEKETKLADSNHAKELLLNRLSRAEDAVTDLKINNHFLFNTLNSMASMALEAGEMALYQSIIHLSKMFHYSVKTQGNLVSMKKELEYIDAYLKLQELRYKNDLVIQYEIDEEVENLIVPFNFLQPIVENAFTHGFHNEQQKRLLITMSAQSDAVVIRISNNGVDLTEDACKRISIGMQSRTTHGLPMVYHKLYKVYGLEFSMKITSVPGRGCRVHVKIPK